MGDTPKAEGPDLSEGVALSNLEEGKPFFGTVDGDPVVVVKKDDRLMAIGARCTHYGGPLENGLVDGDTIRCPWHHAAFDLNTGNAVGAPAFESVGCYPVEIDGFYFRVLPKDDEQPATPPVETDVESVVIAGAGAAASAAVETLRRTGYTGDITMIGAEKSGPVDRPNLSKDYLAGNAPEEWIPLGGDDHWDDFDVQLLTGRKVTDIDRATRTVTTDRDETVSYDRLLYATGAEPLLPPIGGLESTRHFTLRSLEDSRAIVEAAETAGRALVVGASFIGLEVAASLKKRGVDVSVVAPESMPLASILGDELGRLIEQVHVDNGIDFHLGAKVERFDGGTAKLTNSDEIAFDFAVFGVGVRPRTELAESAGLDVDDGVVVDETLQTNDERIYAAGDVARFPEPITGHQARIEHWVVAERQAQTAARNMIAGSNPSPFVDVPFFWSRHFDLNIHYVGYAPNFDDICVDGSIEQRDATVGFLSEGRILAVATLRRALDGLRAERAFLDDDQKSLRKLIGADG